MFVRVHSTEKTYRFLQIKGIPTFRRGRKAAEFKHCAMSIDQDRSDNAVRSGSRKGKTCCVIASEDIRPLCEIFLIGNIYIPDISAHWTFKVTIHRSFEDSSIDDQAPNLPQRRLLEPFIVLHDTPNFEIVGSVSSAYCTSITAQVSSMSPTMGACLNQIIQLSDKGRKEANRKDLRSAVELHKFAFAQLHYFYFPRILALRDRGVLHPDIAHFAFVIRATIRANLAEYHYKLGEPEDALFWARYETLFERNLFNTDLMPIHARLVYIEQISSLFRNRKKAGEMTGKWLKSVRPDVHQDKHLVQPRTQAWLRMRGAGEAEDLKLLRTLGALGSVDHWKRVCRESENS